jgi:hypothetical protein
VAALAALLALCLAAGGSPQRLAAQAVTYFVNTTADLPPTSRQCQAGQECTLRAAIGRAQTQQATVRACYDPAEVPGSFICPLGALPLRKSDPGYDPATGRWTFAFADDLIPLEISGARTVVDFKQDVRGWDGPEDNRIVIDTGGRRMAHGFIIHGSDTQLAGFELRGNFFNAAILLRASIDGVGASNNTLGPGLVLAAITEGVGIRIQDAASVNNKVVGSWCGLSGDGRVVAPLRDDCIQLSEGTWGNVIGGSEPRDGNVLAASELGSGVHVLGADTHENTIQGNWFGLDATGAAAAGPDFSGLESGVTVSDGADGTRIVSNVISANRTAGVAVYDDSTGTVISRNIVGETPDRSACAGNQSRGVLLLGRPTITRVVDNRIACNRSSGITISGADARDNLVSYNSLTDNNGHAIDIVHGANDGAQAPTLEVVTADEVRGQTCRGCWVEVYSDPRGEADQLEGETVADAETGRFVMRPSDGGFTHRLLTATSTEGQNTSALSAWKVVPAVTATPTAASPTATVPPPTRDPGALWSIWLPQLLRSTTR